MCNHYSSSGEWRDLVGEFSHVRLPVFHDRGRPNNVTEHVYPARYGEILLVDDGQLVPAAAYWRFVPFYWRGSLKEWAKPSKPGAARGKSCNNARGEKADTAPMFREAAKNGRCLIPADAFFEWGDGEKAPKAEHRFSAPDGRPFWLAGLWGRSEPEDGPLISFTMVTKACGPDTGSVGHDRQPINLVGDQVGAWMDPANPVGSFLETSPAGTFKVEIVAKEPA
jgi:putative SOS response-associated peptidase YedK